LHIKDEIDPEGGHRDGVGAEYEDQNAAQEHLGGGEDDTLRPGNVRNGFRLWNVEDVLVDETLRNGYNLPPRDNWPRSDPRDDQRSPIEYFYRFFPMQYIETILHNTNSEIIRRRDGPVQHDRAIRPMEQWEFLRWLGIRLAVSLERSRGSLQDLF
jgi:hypothetical protein